MLHCKFSGDYNSERIYKIGQYLTKLCVEHLGFTFLAHHVYGPVWNRNGAWQGPETHGNFTVSE